MVIYEKIYFEAYTNEVPAECTQFRWRVVMNCSCP